jgi:hypothetical protein
LNIAGILKQNIAGKLLNHLAVFVINILMVRMAGASWSGVYFNEIYLLNFIAIFLSLGLDYSAIAWLSNQPKLQASIHKLLIRVAMFVSLLAAFVLLVVMPNTNWHAVQSGWAMFFFLSGNVMLIRVGERNTALCCCLFPRLLWVSIVVLQFYGGGVAQCISAFSGSLRSAIKRLKPLYCSNRLAFSCM